MTLNQWETYYHYIALLTEDGETIRLLNLLEDAIKDQLEMVD